MILAKRRKVSYFLRLIARGAASFIELAERSKRPSESYEVIQNVLKRNQNSQAFGSEEDFANGLRKLAKNRQDDTIALSYGPGKPLISTTIGGNHGADDVFKFHNISVHNVSFEKISNAEGCNLYFGEGASVTISECKILNLTIKGSKSVIIRDCEIGKLQIINSCYEIAILGGSILQLDLPSNATLQKVTIQGTTFSTTSETKAGQKQISNNDVANLLPLLDRQSFSNLFRWAEQVGDSRVAHIARGNELAIELSQSSWFTERAVLKLWKFFGNFGLLPGRSLISIALLTVVYGGVLFFSGTELDPELARGWLRDYCDSSLSSKAGRALYAALNNLFSPISVFSPRKAVYPSSEVGAIAQILHSLLTLGLVILTGFSIRRRFKMS